MGGVLRFIKNWALLLALLIGALGHELFIPYADKTVYLIFLMLLFTFCRIDPSQFRFKKVHVLLLSIQLFGGIGSYYLFHFVGWEHLSESVMMCLLAPTAAASVVVTMKLGGDGAANTTYVLLSSLLLSVVAPLWFPLIHEQSAAIPFWVACWRILRRVLPVMAGPFVLAMVLKVLWKKAHDVLAARHEVSFYLWASCLVFAAAQMMDAMLASDVAWQQLVCAAALSLFLCVAQFMLGKYLGHRLAADAVGGGQSLGQKNVILAIWVVNMFLAPSGGKTPLVIIALGTYIIWQNIINSTQLWWARKQNKNPNVKKC